MRIPKHMAVALSSLAFAGAAMLAMGSAPANAATVTGHDGKFGAGKFAGVNFGEDFLLEADGLFLNDVTDPHPSA